jgi:hypothetical protein
LCDSRNQSGLLEAASKQRLSVRLRCPASLKLVSAESILRLKFTQISFDSSSHRFFSELSPQLDLANFQCPEFPAWPNTLEFPQLFRFGTLTLFPGCEGLDNAFCITRAYHNQLVSSLLCYFYHEKSAFLGDPDAACVLECLSKLSTNIHNMDAEVSLMNFFHQHMSLHDTRIYGSVLALFYNDEGQFQIRCRSCCTGMMELFSP